MNEIKTILENHKELSEIGEEFIEYVLENKECQDRNAYHVPIENKDYDVHFQAWPAFVGPKKSTEFEKITVGLAKLIKAIPERVFKNDAARISDYFQMDKSFVEKYALRATSCIDGMAVRGDFIETDDGLKCIEFNMESNLGGWEVVFYEDTFKNDPLIKRFTNNKQVELNYTDNMNLFLEHVIKDSLQNLPSKDIVNIAIVDEGFMDEPMLYFLNMKYAQVRQQISPHLKGEIVTTGSGQLNVQSGKLYKGHTHVHAVVNYSFNVGLDVLDCLEEGSIRLFNGPLAKVLTQKFSIAALSEYQDSGVFTEEEADLIRKHVPWTRCMKPGITTFKNEEKELIDIVLSHKDDLVFKIANSLGGTDVYLGHSTDMETWETVAHRAFDEKNWIVQERAESKAYMHLTDSNEFCPHDVVWGLFSIGNQYGGGFIRCLPKYKNAIVNNAKGATDTFMFNVNR